MSDEWYSPPLLRNGRGRIRCFEDDCQHWASHQVYMATSWSVNAKVPICDCCYMGAKIEACVGGHDE